MMVPSAFFPYFLFPETALVNRISSARTTTEANLFRGVIEGTEYKTREEGLRYLF
jgi:hypothetical protein